MVDRTVNNTFVSTVSDVLVKAVNSANGTISGNTNAIANETIGELDNTKRNVGTIRSAIADLDTQLANVPQQTKAARNALNDVQLAAASAGREIAAPYLIKSIYPIFTSWVLRSEVHMMPASAPMGVR